MIVNVFAVVVFLYLAVIVYVPVFKFKLIIVFPLTSVLLVYVFPLTVNVISAFGIAFPLWSVNLALYGKSVSEYAFTSFPLKI